jgi:hypothetical protein
MKKQFYLLGVILLLLPLTPSLAADSATLRIVPKTNPTVDSNLSVDILLTTDNQPAAAADIEVAYSDTLQYSGFNVDGSIFETKISDPATSDINKISFSRIRLDKGYSGNDGKIITLNFKVIKEGPSSLSINNEESEVTNYSTLSNMLNSSSAVAYSFTPGTSTTAANQASSSKSVVPTPSAKASSVSAKPGITIAPVLPGNPPIIKSDAPLKVAAKKSSAPLYVLDGAGILVTLFLAWYISTMRTRQKILQTSHRLLHGN